MLNRFRSLEKDGWIKREKGSGCLVSTQYLIGTPHAPIDSRIGTPDAPIQTDGIGTPHARNRYTPCTTNYKNYNNNVRTQSYSDDSPEIYLAKKLWASITRGGTAAKEPDLQKWAKIFDSMHRIDKHPYGWIHDTLAAVRADSFWMNNIKSPDTLRKQVNAGKLDKFIPDSWVNDDEYKQRMIHDE
jgi:hypothetical protein